MQILDLIRPPEKHTCPALNARSPCSAVEWECGASVGTMRAERRDSQTKDIGYDSSHRRWGRPAAVPS